jgi:hypothetical protein
MCICDVCEVYFLFLNSSLETRFSRVIGDTFWQNTSPMRSKETVFPKYASPMTLKGDAVLTKTRHQ